MNGHTSHCDETTLEMSDAQLFHSDTLYSSDERSSLLIYTPTRGHDKSSFLSDVNKLQNVDQEAAGTRYCQSNYVISFSCYSM